MVVRQLVFTEDPKLPSCNTCAVVAPAGAVTVAVTGAQVVLVSVIAGPADSLR